MAPQLLTVVGSKGGVGKTTIAAALLLGARRAGIQAIGLDLDAWQRSLADWAVERGRAELTPTVQVVSAEPAAWRRSALGTELAVVDTPPARDPDTRAALEGLVAASDLVLVPARPALVDLRALVPIPGSAVWVLNAVGRESGELTDFRAWVRGAGEVCPIEVPERKAIQRELGTGEGPDLPELWAWAARRLGL